MPVNLPKKKSTKSSSKPVPANNPKSKSSSPVAGKPPAKSRAVKPNLYEGRYYAYLVGIISARQTVYSILEELHRHEAEATGTVTRIFRSLLYEITLRETQLTAEAIGHYPLFQLPTCSFQRLPDGAKRLYTDPTAPFKT